MDPMADMKRIFFQECDDLLIEIENGLLELDQGNTDPETVNAVFRGVHSIKGGAGAFGLEALVSFAHIFETTLDAVRSNELEASQDVVKVLLRSSDILADLVSAAQNGEEGGASVDTEDAKKELAAFVSDPSDAEGAGAEEEDVDFAPLSLDFDFGDDDDDGFFNLEEDNEAGNRFEIAFKPKPSLYACANDALLLLRNVAELGDATVRCDTSAVPLLEELDADGSYLSWTVELDTEEDQAEIDDIFDFVLDDCELSIKEVPTETSADDDLDVDDNEAPEAEALEAPEAAPEIAEPIAIADDLSEPSAAEPAEQAVVAKPKAVKKEAGQTTIRVSLDRVERLVNLTGELVINQAMLSQAAYAKSDTIDEQLETGLEELRQLTREIQESVMAIRAQPVSTLFQRMSRIVREAGLATGKNVRLVTEGEATELDKTIIERLVDPLTHMIRNAVDHGLEVPEKREAAGKSEQGTVVLSASHRSGRVIIEVRDDGAGINRPRVRQKAIENGLIAESDVLSDGEIDNLLFLPGFSTAGEVSNLSGRGVGMDVVRSAIQSVGGKVMIFSEPGRGTVFTISLPLTLAILDGMIVELAGQILVVPLTSIVETLKPTNECLHALGPGAMVISIRGELIPLMDIAELMGYRRGHSNPLDGVVLLVETEDGQRGALLFDQIQDQRQVVIKSLEENFGTVEGVSAATILGDGRIALILDVEGILDQGRPSQQSYEPLAATG